VIAFSCNGVLIDSAGTPLRDFHLSAAAPEKLTDGRYRCQVTCSEPEMSCAAISDFSEQAYHDALRHARQWLLDNGCGIAGKQGQVLWLDPPLDYRSPHRGFVGLVRGCRRPSMPAVSFVGKLPGSQGLREFSIRIGRPRFTGPPWRPRFSVSLFYSNNPVKIRMFGDWPEEAYCYAFRAARREVGFWGEFVDTQGNPIHVTAPIPTVEAGC